ncbi:uncharacterized protein BP5553_03447 [Venustampulla echinocandica]|uniref:Protein kinase domain-containing protein n=1 Tax=Venustampulla echinocandica TaxID=2656787 RepID=A0A370TUA0_9HELO|nr:uncharacterized protein BP5553_03447 [Venustampulla echinocandica]RDL39107.1 hypothetical protein BP5553_03447 [Venustampulla echinocandica]
MLVGILDSSTFTKFEQLEAEDPSARKEVDGYKIYMSRAMPLSSRKPVLSDLSEARLGDFEQTDFIMPDLYRAPEVALGMQWSHPVDIWGLGMVIWDLFEGTGSLKRKKKTAITLSECSLQR